MAFPAIRTYIIPHPPVQNTAITPKSVSDSGVGTDAVSILVTTTITDSGIGSDNISLLAQIALQDKVISDNFDENYTNTSFWTTYGGDAQVKVQNNELEISTIANQSNYFELETVGQYDFSNSCVQIQIVDAGNQALTSYETIMYLQNNADATNKVYFTISQNQLNVRKIVAGTNSFITGTAYSSTTMKYLRIRRSNGTFYFDYSADAISWTNLTSFADPFTVTNMNIGLQAGNWQSETQAGTSKFDNFILTLGMTIDAVSVIEQVSLTDSGSGSDTTSISAQIALPDSGTASDFISLLATIALSDLGTGSDLISITALLILSDSGIANDALVILAQIALSDTGVASEALAILVAIALSDSGIASEALSILVSLALNDGGIASDVASLVVLAKQNDIGIGSDSVSLLIQTEVDDTGSGNDSLAIQARIPLNDTGAGNDAVLITEFLSLVDSGLGLDQLGVIAALEVDDFGSATETLALQTFITLTDSGQGNDSILVVFQHFITDNGFAIDRLSFFKGGREIYTFTTKPYVRLSGGLYVKDTN